VIKKGVFNFQDKKLLQVVIKVHESPQSRDLALIKKRVLIFQDKKLFQVVIKMGHLGVETWLSYKLR
jgi:hypothetical protein